jgi:hypothetical protein
MARIILVVIIISMVILIFVCMCVMAAARTQLAAARLSFKSFFYNLFTKVQINISRYEAPREETREAYGCLAIGCTKETVVALSVHV